MVSKLKLLRADDLASMLGVSQTTLWRWRRQKLMPQPLSLGPRMIGWRVTDIDSWLETIKLDGSMP
ncbi:MAG: AlpA family phage regulatory protein [Candidatus Thiodiazotropha sp.]|nr:AlpA family phage regulatory protein [Candidatus Thiodiazotropha sp.]